MSDIKELIFSSKIIFWDFDGVIKKVCVEDGEPVEFGQKLVVIE